MTHYLTPRETPFLYSFFACMRILHDLRQRLEAVGCLTNYNDFTLELLQPYMHIHNTSYIKNWICN